MVWLIIVDSNIWIFAEVQTSSEHHLAVQKLQLYLNKGVAVNPIIFSEVFYKLSRIFNATIAKERLQKIIHHPSVKWLIIEEKDADKAAELAEHYSIRINDAIIAQQALKIGVPVLTDNIKDFIKIRKLNYIPLR